MFVVIAALAVFAAPADSLRAGFQNPPLSARPHTWWHWMNGNVTKAGITADLEAMKEVGIGGAQMFTVDQGIPAGPAGYNSKLWRDLTAFAVSEADRLGIELCLHNCAGWSSSGGPWIQPADAMQVLGWSTRVVSGGHVDAALDPIRAPQVVARVDYAKDIAVYAIPGSQSLNPVDLGRTGVVRADGILPDLGEKSGVAKGSILNLTSQFKDGRLVADLPAGDWTILRLGSVPTGKDNHPAPPEGDG
ncbi:MAG: glycosyl hydrolase, partial [Fimbriimonas sp.]